MRLHVPLLFAAAAFALASGTAFAQPWHNRLPTHYHHWYARYRIAPRAYARPLRYEPSAPYYSKSFETPPLPYVPQDDSDASIVLRHTIKAQSEPGVTLELAPDAKETATGGPVGGVPGFSGGIGH